MDAKKKPPRPRYYATEDVAKVVVGIRRQQFFIHKKLASFYSAVLKREFQKVNTEGRPNFIVLEETDAEIFALFAEWLYMQRLDLDEDGSNGITNKSLVRLWVLGEKLVVSSLQNMTINLLHEIYKRSAVISTMNLSYVYENTKAGSPLRRFFVDLCAYGLVPDVLRENPHHFPPEMLLDLAIATSSLLRKSRYEIRDIEVTKYHV